MPAVGRASRLRDHEGEIRKLVEDKVGYAAIGQRYGVTRNHIAMLCHRAGIKAIVLKPKVIANLGIREEELRRLVAQGKTFGAVAEEMGCTRSAVCAYCSRHDIKSAVPAGGQRVTKAKQDRGFDARQLGNSHAAEKANTRRSDRAGVTPHGHMRSSPRTQNPTSVVLPAMTPEEHKAKVAQLQGEMGRLLAGMVRHAATRAPGVQLRDVGLDDCRYPLWPEGGEQHAVCGAPVVPGRSYCRDCLPRVSFYAPVDMRPPREANVIRRKW